MLTVVPILTCLPFMSVCFVVVNIIKFYATVIQVRGLDGYTTRFNSPFST